MKRSMCLLYLMCVIPVPSFSVDIVYTYEDLNALYVDGIEAYNNGEWISAIKKLFAYKTIADKAGFEDQSIVALLDEGIKRAEKCIILQVSLEYNLLGSENEYAKYCNNGRSSSVPSFTNGYDEDQKEITGYAIRGSGGVVRGFGAAGDVNPAFRRDFGGAGDVSPAFGRGFGGAGDVSPTPEGGFGGAGHLSPTFGGGFDGTTDESPVLSGSYGIADMFGAKSSFLKDRQDEFVGVKGNFSSINLSPLFLEELSDQMGVLGEGEFDMLYSNSSDNIMLNIQDNEEDDLKFLYKLELIQGVTGESVIQLKNNNSHEERISNTSSYPLHSIFMGLSSENDSTDGDNMIKEEIESQDGLSTPNFKMD